MKYVSLVKVAIFVLFLAACEQREESPTDNLPCFECENEQNIDTLTNYLAKIVSVYHDPESGIKRSFVIDIQKSDLNNDMITFSADSLLVPCTAIPEEYKVVGKKVLVTGYITSCNELLHWQRGLRFGRKFKINKINEFIDE